MRTTWNNTTAAELPAARIVMPARRRLQLPEFRKVTRESMAEIWSVLKQEPGRTTDFSYGGLFMWVDYFNYEYAITGGTLFIKGVVESDRSKPAFSLPVGRMPMADSMALLRRYCEANGLELELSAVPEYALPELRRIGAVKIEELTDWGDYLYNAIDLATLAGKKYGKKRNHVNQFLSAETDWRLDDMNSSNAADALAFMDVFDLEGDDNDSARAERQLTRSAIREMMQGDSVMEGAILYAGGKVCAFAIGDVKGDTMFVHIEKATRTVPGAYEMINKEFAARMLELHPEVKYINREDCAGDEGLRQAKESYHPVELLRKYNVIF